MTTIAQAFSSIKGIIIKAPQPKGKRVKLDIRDYIVTSKNKRKENVSENIDQLLYDKK